MFEFQVKLSEFEDGKVATRWVSVHDHYPTRLEAERAARRCYGGLEPWRVVEVAP